MQALDTLNNLFKSLNSLSISHPLVLQTPITQFEDYGQFLPDCPVIEHFYDVVGTHSLHDVDFGLNGVLDLFDGNSSASLVLLAEVHCGEAALSEHPIENCVSVPLISNPIGWHLPNRRGLPHWPSLLSRSWFFRRKLKQLVDCPGLWWYLGKPLYIDHWLGSDISKGWSYWFLLHITIKLWTREVYGCGHSKLVKEVT